MSYRNQVLLLGFILFIVILVSLTTVSSPLPYSPDSLFPHYYSYEGLTPMPGNDTLTPPLTGESTTRKRSEEGQQNMNSPPAGSPELPPMANTLGVKTEGFQGLLSSPYGAEAPLDIYSQYKGDNKCVPTAYSNSKGYLCLDDKGLNLLKTRGGNQTSTPAQFGSP